MAPADLLPDVLGVPLGSATPLALANPSASGVVLLLDARFQQQQHLWVHPLTNTATTVITPAGLEAFLRLSIGSTIRMHRAGFTQTGT